MIKIFVFDTNSLISANLSLNSVNRRAYNWARKTGLIVYSAATLKEFEQTFHRNKFDKYISKETRVSEINSFTENGFNVKVKSIITVCRDPKDNKFLELAVDARRLYYYGR